MQAARQQAGSTNIGTGNDIMPENSPVISGGNAAKGSEMRGGKERLLLELVQMKYIHINNKGADGILTHVTEYD